MTLKEKKESLYRWRGVNRMEMMGCLMAWLILFLALPTDVRQGWLWMGIAWVGLGLKSYGSGIDYNEHRVLFYRWGRCQQAVTWESITELQAVSKRTGLLWRKHYAWGFFVKDEKTTRSRFFGVSPTLTSIRWMKETERLAQTVEEVNEKMNLTRLTLKEQQQLMNLLKKEEKK